MNRHDIQVFLIDFPTRGKEVITKNEDDSYTIFLNAKLNHEKQLEVYHHALNHIINEDFEKTNVDEIELQAHNT